jgi:Xaa-Pro aminopeptidase
MPTIDRSVLGQTNTLLERVVDFNRLRSDRLKKVQAEMAARDIGAMLLTDPINIRYCTGVSVMPLWTATNLARYALVPADGMPIIFEFAEALFRADQFWPESRPAYYWQARFTDQVAAERSDDWAAQIKDLVSGWGVASAKLAVDVLDFHGYAALSRTGLTLADADDPLMAARVIKLPDEIELLKQSAAVCEAALYDLEQAIRPGVTENELLGVFWHRLLAFGGEWCSTRLLASGNKTNPWFHEAGSRLVRPGDLVGIDTDMIGPEGYLCDMSRTFLCGGEATPDQREAYRVAVDFIQGVIEMCKPGVSFEHIGRNLPPIPAAYRDQLYSAVLHGVGTDDEPPFMPYFTKPGFDPRMIPQGEFRENMVVSVEFYAGKVGGQDGVKLEDEIWITKDGPVVITLYPFERKLLG